MLSLLDANSGKYHKSLPICNDFFLSLVLQLGVQPMWRVFGSSGRVLMKGSLVFVVKVLQHKGCWKTGLIATIVLSHKS